MSELSVFASAFVPIATLKPPVSTEVSALSPIAILSCPDDIPDAALTPMAILEVPETDELSGSSAPSPTAVLLVPAVITANA